VISGYSGATASDFHGLPFAWHAEKTDKEQKNAAILARRGVLVKRKNSKTTRALRI
jgi:hypothetical protein